MSQIFRMKRSAVAGKVPSTSSLQLGEIALNTTDGKAYFKRVDDTVQSFLTTNALITGSFDLSGDLSITGSTFFNGNSQITGSLRIGGSHLTLDTNNKALRGQNTSGLSIELVKINTSDRLILGGSNTGITDVYISSGTGNIYNRVSGSAIGIFSSTGLDVTGNGTYSGNLTAVSGTFQYISSSGDFVVDDITADTGSFGLVHVSNKVGIGTLSPDAKLHIGSTALATGYDVNATTLAIVDTVNGSQLILRGGSPKIFFDVSGGGSGQMFLDSSQFDIYAGTPLVPSTSRFHINTNGDIGIGTTTPTETLTVNGTTSLGGTTSITGSVYSTGNIRVTTNNSGFIGATTGGGSIDLAKVNSSNIVELGSSALPTKINGTSITLGGSQIISGSLTISGSLIVLGETIEAQVTELNIEDKTILIASGSPNGAAADGAGLIIDRGTNTNVSMSWDNSNEQFVFNGGISLEDKLGIGTSNPSVKLSLQTVSDVEMMRFHRTNASAGDIDITFYHGTSDLSTTLTHHYVAGGKGEFGIYTGEGSTLGFYQNQIGRIGIGTTSPRETLSVNGTTSLGGTTSVTGSLIVTSAGNTFLNINRPAVSNAARLVFQSANVDQYELGLEGNTDDFVLRTDGGTRLLTIHPTGDTGIGGSLNVTGSIYSTGSNFYVHNTAQITQDFVRFYTSNWDSGPSWSTGEFSLFSNHNGTASKILTIQKDNTDVFTIDRAGQSVFNANVGVTGSLVVSSTGRIGTTSLTANTAADNFVVEGSSAGISILATGGTSPTLIFGNNTDTNGALLQWDQAANVFSIASANSGDSLILKSDNQVNAVVIDSNQNVSVESGDFSVTGSLAVTSTITSTANSHRLGNLGIATSDPAVNNTGKAIWADSAGSGVLGIVSSTGVQIDTGGSATTALSIDANQNVSVSAGALSVTASSTYPIDVRSSTDNTLRLRSTNGAADIGIRLENTSDANNTWQIYRHNAGSLYVARDSSTWGSGTIIYPLVINTAGSSSFGTRASQPGYRVNVDGGLYVSSSTGGASVFKVEGTSGSLFEVVDSFDGTLMSVNDSSGVPILTVSSSGQVGINQPNPTYDLHVNGSGSFDYLNVNGNLSVTGDFVVDDIIADTGSFGQVVATNNIAVNRSDASYEVHVDGTGSFSALRLDGGYEIIEKSPSTLTVGYPTSATRTVQMAIHHVVNPVSLGITYSGGSGLAHIDSVVGAYDNNSALQFKAGGSEYHRIELRGSANANHDSNLMIRPLSSARDFVIANVNSTSSMYVDASTGYVGIGEFGKTKGLPEQKLHVSAGRIAVSDGFNIGSTDANTGMFPNVDSLYFQANGTTRMIITGSNGDVGIGTSAPEHTLHVVDAGNSEIYAERTSGAKVGFQAQASSGQIGTTSNHRIQLLTNAAARMTIDTSGRVGIGTSSPTANLVVSSSNDTEIQIGVNSNDRSILGFNEDGSRIWDFIANPDQNASNRFVLRANGSTEVVSFDNSTYDIKITADISGSSSTTASFARVHASDWVGIGTTSKTSHAQESLRVYGNRTPLLNLHRTGGSAARIHLTNDTTGTTATDGAYFGGTGAGQDVAIWQFENSNLTFGTANTERMRIASGSYAIGIGTMDIENWDSGFAAIEFNGSALMGASSGWWLLENAYYDGSWKYKAGGNATRNDSQNGIIKWETATSGTTDAALTWSERMRLTNGGQLLVGTAASSSHGEEVLRVYGSNRRLVNIHSNSNNASLIQFTNNQSGITNASGLVIGIDDSENAWLNNYGSTAMLFSTANTERFRVASDAYALGIGTTDVEAWSSLYAAIEFGASAIMGTRAGTGLFLYDNAYFDGSDKYKTAAEASEFRMFDGYFRWRTASSGAANAALTWSEKMRLNNTGSLFIGDSSNANMTVGLTINQAGFDDEILSLKSSDVNHGMSSILETDTFMSIKKGSASGGGALIRALTENWNALTMQGYADATDIDTTKSSAGASIVEIRGSEDDGGTSATTVSANGNIFGVKNNTSAVFLVDAEGDTWQGGGITAQGNSRITGSLSVSSTINANKNGLAQMRVTSIDGTDDAVYRFYSGGTFKGQIGWDQSTDTVGIFNSTSSTVPKIKIDSSVDIIANTTVTGSVDISGDLTATTKSFLINNPVKGGKLRYGNLEGAEHGIYARGRTRDEVIELPEEWSWLADGDSITVQLTPIGDWIDGSPVLHWVRKIESGKILIDSETGKIDCFYLIHAERKDVPKLIKDC